MLCIYHKGCVDGLMSAAIVMAARKHAEFFAATYGEEPPYDKVAGQDVVIVDFSYPPDQLATLCNLAEKTLVLDHHKTAQASLQGFTHPRAEVVFDMERSGAGITWDYYFPNQPRPWIVSSVEDRDLWRFRADDTRHIHFAITTEPQTVPNYYNMLGRAMGSNANQERLAMANQGGMIQRFFDQQVQQIFDKRFMAAIAGQPVGVCNAPYFFSSNVGERLAAHYPFGATYYFDGKRCNFSLRSRGAEGADVSEIAKQYGGGGHRNAAGFSIESADFPFPIIQE